MNRSFQNRGTNEEKKPDCRVKFSFYFGCFQNEIIQYEYKYKYSLLDLYVKVQNFREHSRMFDGSGSKMTKHFFAYSVFGGGGGWSLRITCPHNIRCLAYIACMTHHALNRPTSHNECIPLAVCSSIYDKGIQATCITIFHYVLYVCNRVKFVAIHVCFVGCCSE